jgi:hypothetical protein
MTDFRVILLRATLALVVSAAALGSQKPRPPATAAISDRLSGEQLNQFKALVQRLAANPPSDCSGPIHDSEEAVGFEDKIFEQISNTVLDSINRNPESPGKVAKRTLSQFKEVSDGITKSREPEARLRYKVLEFKPLLVLKLAIWNQATFIVYAPASQQNNPTTKWMVVQSGDGTGHSRFESLQLSPLWRGPSGNPRFLEVKHFSDCMAGMTLDYIANGYEWRPGELDAFRIIAKKSSFSEEGPKWKFDTSGKIITIPYCWSGHLLLNVDATICSVDTYDLSGDAVRYVRTENDPEDLAVVAKVIKYAQAHELRALSVYCTSSQVARLVLQTMPPGSIVFDVGFSRKRTGPDVELLDFQDGWEMKFTLKKLNGLWLVSDFELERNF